MVVAGGAGGLDIRTPGAPGAGRTARVSTDRGEWGKAATLTLLTMPTLDF